MIEIYNAEKHADCVRFAIQCALKKFEIKEKTVEVDVTFLPPQEMRALNKAERDMDAVTDVLSFPTLESVQFPFLAKDYPLDTNPENGAVMLGEIFICSERAAEQAEEYGHTLSRELAFLAAHGMLHLFGYDHEEGDTEMELLQTEILDAAGITREKTDEEIAALFAKGATESAAKKEAFRFGHAAILGRPNAGKSTLTNALVGEKVAIVSWKPQTTRNRILGIANTETAQIAFLDTPGIHAPRNALGKFMMRSVTSALEEVDVIIYVVDGEKGLLDADKANILRYLKEREIAVVVALNKIDHITVQRVGEILTELSEIEGLAAVVPVSALREKNLKPLLDEVEKLLPYGEKQFDDDLYTDRSMRFMAAETIREKTLRLLDKEIPFGIGVYINKFETRPSGILDIDATVICQKKAHKPILLGKGGSMIKKIATYARQDLEAMTGEKVFLTLWVKVKEDWRDDPLMLNELGYDKPKGDGGDI